jgi:hypothetical protein
MRALLTVDLAKLQLAILLLEQAGYVVTIAPVDLWQHRAILSIWHPVKQDGTFVYADELGLLCHYGISYLNPHGYDEPRYKDASNPHRLKHYVGAVLAQACVDIEVASPGTSNATLNRSAYVLGRYAYGWQIDPETIQARLHDAATARGIDTHEARAVIASALKAGSKNPRDPHDLEVEQRAPQPQDITSKHLAKLSRKLGVRP